MKKDRNIPAKFKIRYSTLRRFRIHYKISFFIIGIASTIWFLVRVIPKPSRAGYPCMRAAAPFMSSFVIYMISISGSALLLKRARSFVQRNRYMLASLVFLGSLILFAISSNIYPEKLVASEKGSTPEDFPSNIPYGTGIGNYPGRVMWAWDQDATDENCTNIQNDPIRGEDGYFLEKNSNQQVIKEMLNNIVTKLTGTTTITQAWDSLFTDFNRRKGLGAITYQPGQKIFIKINQGGAGWLTNDGPDDDLSFIDKSWTEKYYGIAESAPWLIIEVLDQLVNVYGIEEENIFVGDPLAHIYKYHYDMMVNAFPGVKYVDKDENHADIGRTILSESAEPCIFYSDKGDEMPDAISDKLFAEMENADYMINIAALKAHALAGITLTAKNHFGSHSRGDASHLHFGLLGYINDAPFRTEYGMYRVLTDIMGHEKLGGNTVLFIVDGLWGGPEATEKPVKWNMAPFNGDWPNSIFASQDQVALESVCFDFLRSEFADPEGEGKARPWMGGVDDHLHQAADAQFWPDGIAYDPENDGTTIGSLGVHEHWNNMVDMQYSRNLGFNYGIELFRAEEAQNHAVEILGSIPDFEISMLETDLIIHSNLLELFNDPDGDSLEYSVYCTENLLTFNIINGILKVQAGLGYEGETIVELNASDGEFEATIEFKVFSNVTVIGEKTQLGPAISFYPNPFSEIFYVEVDAGNDYTQNAILKVYNLQGQLVDSENIVVIPGGNSISSVNLGIGSPGVYILELKVDGNTFSRVIRKK